MNMNVGNGDHTPLTRPFTANSPQFHFTVGEKNYRLRFLETRPNDIGGSWISFVDLKDANRPWEPCSEERHGHFDLLNEDGSIVKIRYPDDEDTFDDHLEEIKNSVLPTLLLIFKDLLGQPGAVNFQNGEEIDDDDRAANHVPDCGHIFYIYPEDLPQEPS